MSLEADFLTFLAADPGVRSRVGGLVRRGLPQRRGLARQLTVNRVSTVRRPPLGGPDTLPGARFQLDSWGAKPEDADDLAEYLAEFLGSYRGSLGLSGRNVQAIVPGNQFTSDRLGAEAGAAAGAGDLYRSILEVTVWADATA